MDEKFKTVKEALLDKNRAGGFLWCDYMGVAPIFYWSDEPLDFHTQYKVLCTELSPVEALQEMADWQFSVSLVMLDNEELGSPCVMTPAISRMRLEELAVEWGCSTAELLAHEIDLAHNPTCWPRAIEIVAAQDGVYGIDF